MGFFKLGRMAKKKIVAKTPNYHFHQISKNLLALEVSNFYGKTFFFNKMEDLSKMTPFLRKIALFFEGPVPP
jgi:hypothetical protein